MGNFNVLEGQTSSQKFGLISDWLILHFFQKQTMGGCGGACLFSVF